MNRHKSNSHTEHPHDGCVAPRTKVILILAFAVVLLVTVVLWFRLENGEQLAHIPTPVQPQPFITHVETHVQVRFVDVTDTANIVFHHFNGARGKKLLPETMGSGCAFLDFDRDGDQDLLFVNSAPWPGDEASPSPTQALYANNGMGHFSDVTEAAGLAKTFYGMGVAVGDYDGDGWDDIFFTAVGGDRLFRNVDGQTFEEVTAVVGLVSEGSHTWSTSAAFLDSDNDGWLDLFVCRYIKWSPDKDLALASQITGLGRAYGRPQEFEGTFSKLYRNTGSGFKDVSVEAGIEVRNPQTRAPMGKALGVSIYDFDEDGFVDIAVANDTVHNFLFHNRGDGTFDEIGIASGFAFDAGGNTRGAMGIDSADTGLGRAKTIVVGNFANEITALYRSDQPGELPFTDDAISEGIGNPSRKYMKFGVFFFDCDLDGRSDIFEANGHLESEIAVVQAGQTYEQSAQLFWNAGPGAPRGFEVLEADDVGPDLFHPVVGRGCAYADIDGDGDLDIALVSNGGKARLFRNDSGKNGSIRLQLEGTRANRSAFGARVEARVRDRTIRFQLQSGRSYLSQCEQVITVGLADSPTADNIMIYWPGDKTPLNIGTIPAGSHRKVKQSK